MISFIIPSYNRNAYLTQILDSVISQDYKDIEIIVVDDNSSDETETTMLHYTTKYSFIHYHRNNKNMGCGFNRGFGFNQSKGEYVVFADDDDYYTDNAFLNKFLQVFKQYDDLAFVSGLTTILIEKTGETKKLDMNIRGYIEKSDYLQNFSFKYNKPQSTFPTIFKRNALELAGVAKMEMVNDVSIYMRTLLYGSAYIMDEVVGVYRIHDNNITKSLTADFIIENLSEKKYIYTKGLAQGVITDKGWLSKHFLLTITYFFKYSKTSISDLPKMLKWAERNIPKGHVKKIDIVKPFLKGFLKTSFIGPAKQIAKRILGKK